MKRLSIDEMLALVKPNKLRQYPSPKKGTKRLKPFAQVSMRPGLAIPENASFFAVGSCFSRHYERALSFGGFKVLSSSRDTNLPSDRDTTARWFNKFTTDSALNELRWALQGDAGDRGVSTLVEHNGKWSDNQLGWSFAHPHAEAIRYRHAYNAAFNGVATADVVIVATGNTENWYDAEQEVYLNSMVPKQVAENYPNRFEVHYFDFYEAYACLQRVYDVVMKRPGPKPLLLFSVSAVAQPTTFGVDDAMVMNVALQAIQRAAIEQFVSDHPDDVGYIPSYEAFILSDRKFSFMETTFNHGRQECMDRVVSQVLTNLQSKSEGQSLIGVRGLVDSYLTADAPEEAMKVINAHLEIYGEHPKLDVLAARVQHMLGDKFGAFDRYERAALDSAESGINLLMTAFNLGMQIGETKRARMLYERLEQEAVEPKQMEAMRTKLESPVIQRNIVKDETVEIDGKKVPLLAACDLWLSSDPTRLVEELLPRIDAQVDVNDQVRWFYARALSKVDVLQAITYLDQLLSGTFKYDKSASKMRLNLLTRQKNTPEGVLRAAQDDYLARIEV